MRALLHELGEPLLSSTLLLPDAAEPMTDGWRIKEELDQVIDVNTPATSEIEPTTSWTVHGCPEVSGWGGILARRSGGSDRSGPS